MKFGAFTACQDCRYMPDNEQDVLYSLAFTDHYYDQSKLQEISQHVKNGVRIRLPQEQQEMLRSTVKEYMAAHAPLFAHAREANKKAAPPHPTQNVSPDGAVPFNPSLPDITKVQPSRAFQGPGYIIFLVKDAPSIAVGAGLPAFASYPFTMAVIDRQTQKPVQFITLEAGSIGQRFLCVFDRRGHHHNLGSDPRFNDEAVFVEQALSLIQQELQIEISELHQSPNVPPPVPPNVPPPVPGGTDDTKRALIKMLDEMRNEFTLGDLKNPTIKRLYDFTGRYITFLVSGGEDEESDWLSAEIEWMKKNNKIPFPPDGFDRMRQWLRAETPKYQQRLRSLIEAHYTFVMTGSGNPKELIKEIDRLEQDGLLSPDVAAGLKHGLVPSEVEERLRRLAAGEDPSSVYGKKPWWQRLFN